MPFVFQPPYRAAVIGRTGRGDYGHGLDVAMLGHPNLTVVAGAEAAPTGRAPAAGRAAGRRRRGRAGRGRAAPRRPCRGGRAARPSGKGARPPRSGWGSTAPMTTT